MNSLDKWPGLSEIPQILDDIPYQRGVFGKVHGAASDFRWIASTSELTYQQQLELNFFLGAENSIQKTLFWRHQSNEAYYAGSAYSSRSEDSSGRSGFMEKQIAQISNMDFSAAFLALIALPIVEQWQDNIWWDRRKETDWDITNSILPLDSTSCIIKVGQNYSLESLGQSIAKGINDLNLECAESRERLKSFYTCLLAKKTPAILYTPKPLSAEALAVLLLPLPQEIGNKLSLVGWWPNDTLSIDNKNCNWDGIVCSISLQPPQFNFDNDQIDAQIINANQCVQALRENKPEYVQNIYDKPIISDENPINEQQTDQEIPELIEPKPIADNSPLKPLDDFIKDDFRRVIRQNDISQLNLNIIETENHQLENLINHYQQQQKPIFIDEKDWALKFKQLNFIKEYLNTKQWPTVDDNDKIILQYLIELFK